MKASGGAPAWAVELVRDVCAAATAEPPGTLRWTRRDRPSSSGVTRRSAGSISIVAGSDELDQRLTLLHELAHWIGPTPGRRRGRGVHHGARFYATAFALYQAHGLTDAEAIARESSRYPSSLRHAVALGIGGALDAWRARRSELRTRVRRPWRVIVADHSIRLERDGRWTVCAVCRQRIIGPNLARLRRRGARGRHVLMSRT